MPNPGQRDSLHHVKHAPSVGFRCWSMAGKKGKDGSTVGSKMRATHRYRQTFGEGTYQQRFFAFLVLYRWVSLSVPLWSILLKPTVTDKLTWAILGLAILHTGIITLWHRWLNRWVTRYPYLLGVDVLLSVAFIGLSGGIASPYYLYALSPVLAGAFFFRYRGALLSAALFTTAYLATVFAHPLGLTEGTTAQMLFMQLAGIWLLPALIAYPATLLQRLQEAHAALQRAQEDLAQRHAELQAAHQQLTIIHDLTLSLQAAPDVETVQQRVLEAITQDLQFPRAAIGLINPITQRLERWRASPTEAFPSPPPVSLPLNNTTSPIREHLMQPSILWWKGDSPLTGHPALDAWLGPGPWIVLPLALREHPVGIALVGSEVPFNALPAAQQAMLRSVAEQAAVVLGTIMLCIDRARRLAVEHERNRIAREMHDVISQSLFGIVLSLDACIKMLPHRVHEVRAELTDLRNLASHVHQQLRQSILDIWPSELTLERFKNDLRKYARHVNQARLFHIEFNTGGDFDHLSPLIRRTLYRVAQEAVVNAIRHGQVDWVRLCLRVDDTHVYMSVRDEGQGFDTNAILCREYNREHFGLRGIQERVQALGGECQVYSRPQAGTLLLVSIPINGEYAYEGTDTHSYR